MSPHFWSRYAHDEFVSTGFASCDRARFVHTSSPVLRDQGSPALYDTARSDIAPPLSLSNTSASCAAVTGVVADISCAWTTLA